MSELLEDTMHSCRVEAESLSRIENYHASTRHDSHSSLEQFRESRSRYAAIRIFKTLPWPTPTEAMIFGNVFGCALLEPDDFNARYIVAPNCDRRTKAGKALYAEFEEQADGKTIITADQLALAKSMREAALDHPTLRNIIEADGWVEKVYTWVDRDTAHPLKCRTDKTLKSGIIFDLKTVICATPDALSRAVANFGYHRQASLYLTGTYAAEEVEGPFVFGAVCKEPPHEVVVFSLDDNALAVADEQNQATIRELHECYETGDWGGRWSKDILTISLPKWAQTY